MTVAVPLTWGVTRAEARRPYAADHLVDGTMLTMTRAVGVAAPQELTWRWLCQISVAPYSYDLLDNRGRRSPRTLTPGADQLVLGHPRPRRLQGGGVAVGAVAKCLGQAAEAVGEAGAQQG